MSKNTQRNWKFALSCLIIKGKSWIQIQSVMLQWELEPPGSIGSIVTRSLCHTLWVRLSSCDSCIGLSVNIFMLYSASFSHKSHLILNCCVKLRLYFVNILFNYGSEYFWLPRTVFCKNLEKRYNKSYLLKAQLSIVCATRTDTSF